MKNKHLAAILSIILLVSLSVSARDMEADFKKVSERKPWGFSISPYASLGADRGTDLLDVDFTLKQWILDTRLGYLI